MSKKLEESDRPRLSAEQLLEIGRQTAERSFSEPQIASKLKASGLILCFKYYDPQHWGEDVCVELTLDFTKDPFEIVGGPEHPEPNLTMSMHVIYAHLFWMQKLNLMVAITRKQIQVKGPIAKAMKLLPALKPVYVNYREVLKEQDREDLLAWPPE